MTARDGGIFVTGTDTGVGKTLIACALLHALAASGRAVIGMKPVAAGREDGRFHDVTSLMAASTVCAPESLINPYAFDPAIAPHIAAAQTGAHISIEKIAQAYARLSALVDVVVVEGATEVLLLAGEGGGLVGVLEVVWLGWGWWSLRRGNASWTFCLVHRRDACRIW